MLSKDWTKTEQFRNALESAVREILMRPEYAHIREQLAEKYGKREDN